MFQTSVLEKIETNILCSKPFLENRTVYEIMWKNNAERVRLQMTIWRLRISCWIPKATETHSEYVVLIVLPVQQWLLESVYMSLYKYIACLVYDSHIQHVNILC
jgi:hypothetical protein